MTCPHLWPKVYPHRTPAILQHLPIQRFAGTTSSKDQDGTFRSSQDACRVWHTEMENSARWLVILGPIKASHIPCSSTSKCQVQQTTSDEDHFYEYQGPYRVCYASILLPSLDVWQAMLMHYSNDAIWPTQRLRRFSTSLAIIAGAIAGVCSRHSTSRSLVKQACRGSLGLSLQTPFLYRSMWL